MRLEKRIAVAMAVLLAAPISVAIFVIVYLRVHPGPLPTSIFFLLPGVLLCAFVAALVIVGAWRTRSQTDAAAGFAPHSPGAAKAIKAGLVIYVLGLLNGIRLVAEHAIPLKYALVGFTVCIALIAAHWKALKRLDKIKQLATIPGAQVK